VKIQRVGVFAVSQRVDCCCEEIDILLGEGPATYQIFFLVFRARFAVTWYPGRGTGILDRIDPISGQDQPRLFCFAKSLA
jgi:hypothetical protein